MPVHGERAWTCLGVGLLGEWDWPGHYYIPAEVLYPGIDQSSFNLSHGGREPMYPTICGKNGKVSPSCVVVTPKYR